MASFLSALSELHDTLVAALSSCGGGLDGTEVLEAKPELMRGTAAGSHGGFKGLVWMGEW